MTKEEIWTKAQKCAAADKIDDDTREYVNFAFWLLENEIESDDIFILAGLSESDISFRYDARRYFALVCDALSFGRFFMIWNCQKIFSIRHIAKSAARA